MKKIVIIFLLLPIVINFSQNTDSLFNELLRSTGKLSFGNIPQVAGSVVPIKCGFGIVNQVKLNYDKFTKQQQKTITGILQRPSTDTSFVTPSGHFRIHFNKSGSDAPAYNLNELAIAADSSYNYEVNIIGFPPPPKDNGAGGDDSYDIYIQDLGSGSYGYTELDQQIKDSTYTAFSVIDNDFGTGFYTHGIEAAKVTVAHEFHHGIQVGNYIYRPDDTFYHELTSVSMEKFVFGDIDDYIGYLEEYFYSPDRSFASNSGYDLAIWNLFLRKRFGFSIIIRTWELMSNERALLAVSDAIQENGSTFKIEYNTFGQWTYFTKDRSVPGKYFEDAEKFPLINPLISEQFTNPLSTFNINSQAVSNNFLVFNDYSNGTNNVIVSIISNCDISGGLNEPFSILPFTYSLTTGPNSGYINIIDGYYFSINGNNNFLLSESHIFNNAVVNGGQITSDETDYVFPQPFRYSQSAVIYFPVLLNGEADVDFYIYSIDMNLVYSSESKLTGAGKAMISWNGLDSNGKRLASGIYIYVTKSNDLIRKGKFAVLNN